MKLSRPYPAAGHATALLAADLFCVFFQRSFSIPDAADDGGSATAITVDAGPFY